MIMIISLFRLLFHPLFKWVYKYDFENLENTIKIHREVRVRNDKEIQDLKSKLDGFRYWEKNMKEVIKDYKWNNLALTPKDEIVVISDNGIDMRSLNIDIVLTNLRFWYGARCCKLGASPGQNGHVLYLLKKAGIDDGIDSSNMVTITDIQCSEKNNGYGSTLLSYFIERAQEQQIKVIAGWLSPVDRDRHDKLERFYKRLQFDVYFLLDSNEGVIIRKIK
jgi:hypothetical protein